MLNRKSALKLVTIILLAAFVFVGCTGGGDNNSGNNNQSSGPIVLQWWGVFWDADVVESLIVEYQEQNPNVKIEYVNKWSPGVRNLSEAAYQNELNRVLRDRNSAEIPDIFMVHNTWVGEYDDYIAPAPNNVVDAQTIRTSYYPAVATDFAQGDVVRGLPLWMDALAVLYNRDILNQASASAPPDNWQDFRNLAFAMTQRTGATITQAGFSAGEANNVGFSSEALNLLFLQNGVQMTNSNGIASFSTSAFAEETVNFYQAFASTGGSWSDNLENDALEFTEGRLAMMLASSWQYHDILYWNERYNLGLDIGVASVPQVQSQAQRIDWATYWGNVVSRDRPNSQESWEFINWLSQPQQLRKLRQNESLKREFFGFLYPRTDMQQDLLGDDYLSTYNSILPTAQSWYMVNGLEVKAIFAELIESAGSASDVSTAENAVQRVIDQAGRLPAG